MPRTSLWSLSLLAYFAAPAAAADLVRDGKSVAVVALPPAPTDTEKLAARELVEHVEKMSGAKLETATVELYRRTFDVNVLGTLLVTQATAAHMGEGGAIVNFASIDAFVPSPGQLVYCASKAAVVALTRSLALELAPRVRVNAIAPGWVDTPGNRATGRM